MKPSPLPKFPPWPAASAPVSLARRRERLWPMLVGYGLLGVAVGTIIRAIQDNWSTISAYVALLRRGIGV